MTKKWLSFALKFGVSAVLIWFISTNFDVGESINRLKSISPLFFVAALALFIVQFINNTTRWYVVLRAIESSLPFTKVARLLYIGLFFNQTLPSAVGGDAVRMFLARKEGLSLKGAVNGVMLERVVTVIGLILLVVATQPFLLSRIGDNPAKYVFPALAVAGVIGVIALMLMDRFPEPMKSWRLIIGLAHLASDTKRLFLSPATAIMAIALGVMGNILLSAAAFALARSLAIDVTFIDFLVLFPPVILITTIPISIAGWGLREGAMVAAFGFIGVAEGDAFVLSILFGLTAMAFSLPGGLVWLFSGYKRADMPEETPLS
jgi:uncharacterized membrane protein YbhN (UPF0104 family)